MSNVIKFPEVKTEKQIKFEEQLRDVQEAINLLVHELDQDDSLGWHRANIVETFVMELIVDLCAGASVKCEGAQSALEWLCEEINMENVQTIIDTFEEQEEPKGTIH